MNRTQIVLSVTLVLQLVVILATRTHEADTAGLGQPHSLLPEIENLLAMKIELSSKDGETLTLMRKGDAWSIEQAGGYPADNARVEKLIADLQGIEVRNPVVTSEKYHEALEVTDETARGRVKVWGDPAGDPVVDLLFGKSAGMGANDMRLAGQDDVWEISGIASYDIRPQAAAWIETKLAGVASDRVTGLRITNSNGSFEIRKDGESWVEVAAEGGTPATLNADEVESLVRTVANLSISDPIGPVDEQAHGLAAPAATATIVTGGEQSGEIEIRIGSLTSEDANKRYATRSGSGFTASVWKSSTDPIVDASVEKLTGVESQGAGSREIRIDLQ